MNSLAGLALLVGLAGCAGETAGTTSYKNPVSSIDEGAIISAQTLIKWADEGKINAPFGTADRVVVVSATTRANFVSRRHIPDAVLLDSSGDSWREALREEGTWQLVDIVRPGDLEED